MVLRYYLDLTDCPPARGGDIGTERVRRVAEIIGLDADRERYVAAWRLTSD